MPFLSEEAVAEIRRAFESLRNPVSLEVFTRARECPYGPETRDLMREVGRIHENVRAAFIDLGRDPDAARAAGVDKAPCVLLRSGDRVPVRFYGIPSGSEFQSFLEAILDVSSRETPLKASSKATLAKLSRPLHVQVFVSPTCEFCPHAVRWATLAAIEQPAIRTDIVKSTDFEDLARRYFVTSVPTVVVDEETSFAGAVPEKEFVKRLLNAVD